MRKTIVLFVAVIAIGLCCGVRPAFAQENPGPAKAKPVQAYRLDFSFNEVLDDKKVNTRHYSLDLTMNEGDEIKIGTRVPVPSGIDPSNPQFQYMDVGTNIWARLTSPRDEEDVQLSVRSEVSNLDIEATEEHSRRLPPVVRQIKIEGSTLLVLGKPMLIGVVDDPNSKRQFQLEVTATKLH
jgi:hypothetical protein